MSEYNCRVKRVVPKDNALELGPVQPYGAAECQLGRTQRVNGTCLCFIRLRLNRERQWGPWSLSPTRSEMFGRFLHANNWPDWKTVSALLHHRPQEQT